MQNNLRDNYFKSIGTIAANGNSNSTNTYEYIDKSSNKTGEHYYRLKMIDLDGSFEYSPLRLVDFGIDFSLSIYPNPSDGNFDFHVNVKQMSTGILQISNPLGQLIFEERIDLVKGRNNLNWLLTDLRLDGGIYHVVLLLDGERINKQLLIQRTY